MTAVTDSRPRAGAPTRGGAGALAGTGTLIRFMLRRDRVRIPVWIVAIVLGMLSSLPALPEALPPEDLPSRAALMENPAMGLLASGYQVAEYTYGVMVSNEFGPTMMIVMAFMGLFLAVRHTRAEEESGRAELVRAGIVGRHANTAATLVVVGGAIVLTGVLLALGSPAALADLSMAGSWAFAAAMTTVGLVFAAVALVAAQFTENARGATGISMAVFGIAYALRSLGVMADVDVLVWLSPLGWAQEVRPFIDDRWWPLLLNVALSVGLVAVAMVLSTRRDVGAGLRAARVGPAGASGRLHSSLGLAWRLQRASLIAWGTGMLAFGLFFGGAVSSMEEFAQEADYIQEFLAEAGAGALIDQAIGQIAGVIAVTAVGFAVQSALYLRREETALRAEPVLATRTSRLRWAASHLVVALAGVLVILLVAGLGFGVTAAVSLGEGDRVLQGAGAMLAYVPAMWVFVGLVVALFGLVPRAAGLVWALAGVALFMNWMGVLLEFPGWLLNLNPLAHVPAVPSAEFTVTPLAWLTVAAAGLIAVGLVGFRRRDLG